MATHTPYQPGTIGPLDYEQLGETVKALRTALRLTQLNVAGRTPLTTRTIQRLEKGGKTIRPLHLEEICQALGYELRQEQVYVLTPLQKLIDSTTSYFPVNAKISDTPG